MGKYNHQNLQVLHYNKTTTTTFLPMLCSRPSIKDVTVPKSLSSSSFSDDPLSPKIGCMGQVKRVQNNKIIGFSPSPSSSHHQNLTTITTSVHHNSKLKRLFSNTTSSSSSSSRSRQGRIRGRQRSGRENEASVPVNIADMDPPLPVVKKVNRPSVDGEDNNNNLYKRRSGGITLTSLQLQHVHTSKCPLQAKTV